MFARRRTEKHPGRAAPSDKRCRVTPGPMFGRPAPGQTNQRRCKGISSISDEQPSLSDVGVRFQHGALGQHARLQEPPQRDQELSRQCDDSDFEYVENFEAYAEADENTINVEGYFEKAFNFACSYFY